MIATKICPICLKEFTTSLNAKKSCSEWCRKKARKNEDIPKLKECVCGWCGGTFLSLRRKVYCSNECRMFANGRYSMPKPVEKPKEPAMSLEQTVALARLAGLSYGEYVQKHNV